MSSHPMIWRPFSRERKSDIRLLERICRESGSVSVAKHAAFLRTAMWHTQEHPENLWCEILNESAFYMCTRCRSHVRCIDTAVVAKRHGLGWGRALAGRMLGRMRAAGISMLTFRTNRDDSALGFWLKQGAQIVDVRGDDYEMELHIKL